jgi:hypothetical protein
VTCSHLPGGVVICRGPKTEAVPTKTQRSAGYCQDCKRRRVQTLVGHWPIVPSYYGPHLTWRCPDGHDAPAPGWEFE